MRARELKPSPEEALIIYENQPTSDIKKDGQTKRRERRKLKIQKKCGH